MLQRDYESEGGTEVSRHATRDLERLKDLVRVAVLGPGPAGATSGGPGTGQELAPRSAP